MRRSSRNTKKLYSVFAFNNSANKPAEDASANNRRGKVFCFKIGGLNPPRVALFFSWQSHLSIFCSNDRQVLQRSPEVLRFSLWLESSVGHYAAYTFVSIPPVGSVVLAIAGRAEAAVGVITLQVLVLAPCLSASFLVLGKSLLKGIDDSLQQQQQRQQQLQAMGVTPEHGKKPSTASSPGRRSSGDLMLLAARKKVKRVVMFAVALPTQTACMLLFAAVTRFGTEAPLLLFFFPMTFTPPIWNIVNVGIHQGRTQLSLSGGGPSFRRPRISSISISSLSWRRRSQQRQVAAVETSTGAPRLEGSGLDR